MKRTKKVIGWTTAVVFATVSLLLIGGYLWLNSEPGRDLLLNTVNASIPGRITVKGHRLSLIDLAVDLFDVRLYGPDNGQPIGIEHLHVDVAWLPLLHREVRIESVVIEAPRIDLAVDGAGGVNIVDAFLSPGDAPPSDDQSAPGSLPVNIVCPTVRLSDGRLTVSLANNNGRIIVNGIDITASGELAAMQAGLTLAIADIGVDLPGIGSPQPISLALEANLKDSALTVVGVRLATGNNRIKIEGRVADLFSRPDIDGRISMTGSLAELASIAGLDGEVLGTLKADLRVAGSPDNPDADLTATIRDGRFAGITIDHVDARLNLDDRRLTLEQIELQRTNGSIRIDGAGDLREAFPTGFFDPPGNLDTITYQLKMNAQIPELDPWLPPEIRWGGGATGQIAIDGHGISLPAMQATANLGASADHLSIPEIKKPVDARCSLAAELAGGNIAVKELVLTTDGIRLSGTGNYGLQDEGMAGHLSLVLDDLSRSLAAFWLPAITGSGQMNVDVGGTLAQPRVAASLTSENLGTGVLTVGSVAATVRMAPDGRIDIDRLTVDNGDSKLFGDARMRLSTEDGGLDPDFENHVDLRLENVSVGDFMAASPLEGRFDGRLQLGGRLYSPEGSITLDGRGIETQGVIVDRMASIVKLAGERVTIDRLQLEHKESTVLATGTIDLFEPGTLNLAADPAVDLDLEAKDLDPSAIYPVPVAGQLALAAHLEGNPSAPSGQFRLTGHDIDISGQPVSQLDIAGRLLEQRLWIDTFIAELAPEAALTLEGSIGLDFSVDLSAQADRIPFSAIAVLGDNLPGRGFFDLTARARGPLDNPEITGQVTATDMEVNHQRVADIRLDIALSDMQARVNGRLNFAVDAVCDLRGGDFDARLDFDQTSLGTYMKMAGQPDLQGVLSGTVHAKGNFNAMAGVAATADFSQLELDYQATPLVRSDRFRLGFSGKQLSIEPTTLTVFSTGRVDLAGNILLDGAMDATIDAQLPLSDVALFNDQLGDVAGSLNGSARLTGSAQAPQIDARIEVEQVAMAIPGTDQRLHNLTGKLTVDNRQLKVEHVTGQLDTGTFSLEGTLDHDNWTPTRMNLTARARALPVDIPDTLSLLLSGEVRLTGSDRKAAARGDVVILEGVYDRDVKINLLQLVGTRQRSIKPESAPPSVPFFDTVELDVGVGYRQPFIVDNNLAQLEITPDLTLGGTLARPILSGRAQVQEGTLTFQGKTFDVKKGVIDFINPYKTEAEIDIESEATISTWTVTLAIQGTPENLDLKLSSVPELTNADILSVILFGKPASELASGQGGSRRTTSQIMAEMIADTFGEDIKKHTGVDILEVSTGESETTSTSGDDDDDDDSVKVTVGKHLSDRMTVKYAVQTKSGEVVQRAITEYQLLENILISGFQDSQGVYGSELVFRLEFR